MQEKIIFSADIPDNKINRDKLSKAV